MIKFLAQKNWSMIDFDGGNIKRWWSNSMMLIMPVFCFYMISCAHMSSGFTLLPFSHRFPWFPFLCSSRIRWDSIHSPVVFDHDCPHFASFSIIPNSISIVDFDQLTIVFDDLFLARIRTRNSSPPCVWRTDLVPLGYTCLHDSATSCFRGTVFE